MHRYTPPRASGQPLNSAIAPFTRHPGSAGLKVAVHPDISAPGAR